MSALTVIRSESAAFQLLEALRHNRRKREQRAEFLVEGVRAIDRCVSAGWPVRAVLSADGVDLSRWAVGIRERLPDAEIVELRADLFARLTDREEPPELLLVAQIPTPDLTSVPRPPDGVVVVVDRPTSPGNLGTIIRTADAQRRLAVRAPGRPGGQQRRPPRLDRRVASGGHRHRLRHR